MLSSTVGQIFANETLPEDLRDYDRVLDKKGIKKVLRDIALQYPERYKEISHKLNQLGRTGAQESGSFSFGVRHMKKSKSGNRIRDRLKAKIKSILQTPDLTDKRRNELLVRAAGAEMATQQDDILAEALADENPLALQVLAGARGNKMNLSSLMGSDLLYADSTDNPLPIPVLRSYSEGLSPAEYFAGSYGARKGIIATKFATQDAGFLGKQLNQVAHRLVVTDKDYADEGQRGIRRGMPVDTEDQDNEGALLAQDVGPYKRNTVITPKVRKHLKRLGHKKILVRSPLVGGSPSGGVYARDVGVRERGNLPGKGSMVGLQAAQALSEPLSQGQLSAKHSGGVAGEEKAVSGFQYINQLIQVPKVFKGGAAHSTEDGTVQRIEAAPAGGHLVTINDNPHYVAKDFDLRVKKGDKIEAGDILSEGFPNPSLVTQYKGVGEGRRYFVNAFRDAMRDAGLGGHRRNIELLSRGLINHVRLTDEYGENVPDDVIPYSTLEHRWKPREGHRKSAPKQAVGKYLEQPVLHYTIGTKVRPSMLKNFKEFGIDEVQVHDDPPPFKPEMIRGMYSLQHDPDWLTRFYGSGVKKSLLSATQRGAVSEERGTSFVPSISRSVDFGRIPDSLVKKPVAPYEVEETGEGIKVAAGPNTTDGNSVTSAGSSPNPGVIKPPPIRNNAITQPRSPNNLSGGYNASRGVKPYSNTDFKPQQNLPGMLGNPMGMQLASQMGPTGLMAAASPTDYWTAIRAKTTDARLGGLSSGFYDAASGGVDPYGSMQYGGYGDGVVSGSSGGYGSYGGGGAGPSDEYVPPAGSESPYQSGTNFQNAVHVMGVSTGEGQQNENAFNQGLSKGIQAKGIVNTPKPTVPKPPSGPGLGHPAPKPSGSFFGNAVGKAKNFANKIPGFQTLSKGHKLLSKVPGIKHALEPLIYGSDIYANMQDGMSARDAFKDTGDGVLDSMQGWQDWLTNADGDDNFLRSSSKRLAALGMHGLTGPVQAALGIYAAGDETARSMEQSADVGEQAAEQRNQNANYGGAAIDNLDNYSDGTQSEEIFDPISGLYRVVTQSPYQTADDAVVAGNNMAALTGHQRAETARGQSINSGIRANQEARLSQLRQQQLAQSPSSPSSQALQRQIAETQKYLNTSDFARDRANMSTTGRVLDDVSNRSMALPIANDVDIPGTDTGVKQMASWSDIWNGNFSLNPFYSRSARANERQRALNAQREKGGKDFFEGVTRLW